MQTLVDPVKLIEVLSTFEADVAKCIRRKLKDWPLVGLSLADGFELVASEHKSRCVSKWEQASARIDAESLDPRAWVFRQLYDTFSDLRRQEHSKSPQLEPFASWSQMAASISGPATKAQNREWADRLHTIVRELPECDRHLVELRMDDLTWAQIAEVLELKNATAAKRKYVEVIRRLKTLLEER